MLDWKNGLKLKKDQSSPLMLIKISFNLLALASTRIKKKWSQIFPPGEMNVSQTFLPDCCWIFLTLFAMNVT